MDESDVGKKLAKHSPRFLWKPIADKYGYGTPDRCVMERGVARVLWGELKHISGLPKRKAKISCYQAKQAQWLAEWKRNGGECYLIVGVGNSEVAFFADGFLDLCENGIERDRYDLMKYNQVESYLLSYANKEKLQERWA